MGQIRRGHGSEWHLLRYLGRHREALERAVLAETGGMRVRWLDFPFSRTKPFDAEWTGLDFIEDERVLAAWGEFWPQTGSSMNWDAVGELQSAEGREWLLVEAKAHVEEIRSSCGAKREGGLAKIREALKSTKEALGARPDANWLSGYYQYCNRLACLHFLVTHGVPARLVLIYFLGDEIDGQICPQSTREWQVALREQEGHVGLAPGHPLAGRVHKVFLRVGGPIA